MSLREIRGVDPNYDVIKKIGEGAFANVYKVSRKSDGKVLACKAIKIESVSVLDMELVKGEVAALRALAGCRNVVQWEPDVTFDAERLMIRLHMEYYHDGDLKSLIYSRLDPVPKDTVTQVFCCLAMALLDCHSRGICHRDIKPANILLSKKVWNGQMVTVACLSDFGVGTLSSMALTSGVALDGSSLVGTPIYMAPESLREFPVYSERSDLFSLGCTMYELCNRRLAYTDTSRESVPSMCPTALRNYSGRLIPLMTSLMQASPAQRPSTQQLVAALETYCASRWEKQKATLLWESLAVVSKGNPVAVAGKPPLTGLTLPPWEQHQQQQAFQLPPALQALQQQQRQQPPLLPPGLQQATQVRQVHQQHAAVLRQAQMHAAQQQRQQQQEQQQQLKQQFGSGHPPWN